MSSIQTRMTARQFQMLGEDPPGLRLELVDGEVYVSPSPTRDHGYAITQLIGILRAYIKEHDLGELNGDVDTEFDEHEVRRPDLLFIRKDRVNLIHEGHGYNIAPDLAVEVVSPGSRGMDRDNKFDLYQRKGVPHYWIIDPKQKTFEAYTLTDGEYLLQVTGRDADEVRSEPFPDLTIPLNELWLTKA